MSARRPPRRPTRHSRPILGWGGKLTLAATVIVIAIFAWAFLARRLQPLQNTTAQHFDAIIVLGTPADSDGNPTPTQLDRVTEAVREYQRGVAPRILLTGGPAHNRFVEAQVMARVAQAQGIPPGVLLIEPRAQDTIQNACFSTQILAASGLHSAEVISSASHLPRAAMIFSNLPQPLLWRMHPAPSAMESGTYTRASQAVELLKTARYLLWARWLEHC